jgi:hypothetical protein
MKRWRQRKVESEQPCIDESVIVAVSFLKICHLRTILYEEVTHLFSVQCFSCACKLVAFAVIIHTTLQFIRILHISVLSAVSCMFTLITLSPYSYQAPHEYCKTFFFTNWYIFG